MWSACVCRVTCMCMLCGLHACVMWHHIHMHAIHEKLLHSVILSQTNVVYRACSCHVTCVCRVTAACDMCVCSTCGANHTAHPSHSQTLRAWRIERSRLSEEERLLCLLKNCEGSASCSSRRRRKLDWMRTVMSLLDQRGGHWSCECHDLQPEGNKTLLHVRVCKNTCKIPYKVCIHTYVYFCCVQWYAVKNDVAKGAIHISTYMV